MSSGVISDLFIFSSNIDVTSKIQLYHSPSTMVARGFAGLN